MAGRKSSFNPCPVCGLPRGKGPSEFVHGRCIEQRAKTEGKKTKVEFMDGETVKAITVDQHKTSQTRRRQKDYLAGKLPDWMYS